VSRATVTVVSRAAAMVLPRAVVRRSRRVRSCDGRATRMVLRRSCHVRRRDSRAVCVCATVVPRPCCDGCVACVAATVVWRALRAVATGQGHPDCGWPLQWRGGLMRAMA